MTTRRTLLQGLGALAALSAAPPARAFGEASLLDIGELTLSRGTVSRPSSWQYLLSELERTTSVSAEPRAVQVDPATPALAQHPFAVMLVDGPLPDLEDVVLERLSAFLAYGGFLFIDDTTGGQDRAADASVRALVSRLFPNRPLTTMPSDHALHRAFFLLRDGTPGRLRSQPWMESVTTGNLSPLVYGRNDLSGALERSVTGRPSRPCSPGGESQRREALKVGINLVMYALTANYKKDQAHVQQLLLDKRLDRPTPNAIDPAAQERLRKALDAQRRGPVSDELKSILESLGEDR